MTSCKLCGGQTLERFRTRDYRRPHDPTEWPLDWCFKCEFGRLRGEFNPDLVSSFYQTEYYTHGSEQSDNRKPPLLDRLRVHLAWRRDNGIALGVHQIIQSDPDKKSFCDLGRGSGEHLKQFKEAGFEVIGVKPEPIAQPIAQSIGEVLDGTAEKLPEKILSKRFDMVLLSHVLEHCVDPLKALSNVRAILSRTGSLVVEVPNNAPLGFSLYGATWPWTDIPRHLNFFTERSLKRALELSGFQTNRVIYTGYTCQFFSSWVSSQKIIWEQIHEEPAPNFDLAAWKLLFRTAFSNAASKYDSIRVHAATP